MKRQPQPTSKEIAAWRKLIREATHALEAGDRWTGQGDLFAASKVARRSVIPIGLLTVANPFVRLQRLTMRHAEATAAQRRDGSDELRAVVAECERLLQSRAAGPPTIERGPPRPRADIDG